MPWNWALAPERVLSFPVPIRSSSRRGLAPGTAFCMSAAMAPPLLSYEQLGLIQGSGWLFRGLNLSIGPRDRLALIGRNGAGKTTLLKLIGGQIEADEGKRSIVAGTHVVTLEQDPDVSASRRCAISRFPASALRRSIKWRPLPTSSASTFPVKPPRPRAASAAALRSAGRWPASPTCCCSTSRPTISISRDRLAGGMAQPLFRRLHRHQPRPHLPHAADQVDCIWLDRGNLRRNEIGFGGFEAWMEAVYAEEARATPRSWTRSSRSRRTGWSAASPPGASATRDALPSSGKCAPSAPR
jgi:ATP-binding cassette subfamily F protein uup